MSVDEKFLRDLPDRDSAVRFLTQLEESQASQLVKLVRNDALLSDVLTIVSFSPLLATTLLQNPEYFSWLDRKRRESGVSSKDELLESLARFALTNSTIEPQVTFARFRRRELLRIYLRDIRRLATVPEITEEISNLADATLEYALRLARNEMDSRFGQPQEPDEKGRPVAAKFCVAALGKLGSRELNYSSDIDLLFLYSSEGTTSGNGSRGQVTNREYFVKLAEFLTRLVGHPSGEGAAYRVDLRLRPHGSLGPLAQTVEDLVRYYETEARPWERQVMIRSRGCAGDSELFRDFFSRIEHLVFSADQSIEDALTSVRESKRRIDTEQSGRVGFDVKLGRGGIREIEFLAQALQLAHAGRDEWLRAPHTLISLDRLRDRRHISDAELTELATAYDLLRRIEHILQMENGVQTHAIPEDAERRRMLARRVKFATAVDLEESLLQNTVAVHRIYERVFGSVDESADATLPQPEAAAETNFENASDPVFEKLAAISPHFSSMVAANPMLKTHMSRRKDPAKDNYRDNFTAAIERCRTFRERLAALRQTWSRALVDIVTGDVSRIISLAETKRLQTELAEASIDAAIKVVRAELGERYKTEIGELPLAILALGKLGGKGVDYDSDLDLVLVYDAKASAPLGTTQAEFFSRAAELFVTTLSSMTRDGHLYRVDLRLRPYGTKGLSAMSSDAFLEYMKETAVAWEMLAFVKLRAVGRDLKLGRRVENETRNIIHQRAAAIDMTELRDETIRVRDALETQRARTRRSGEVDIKYGAGGLLDIYFAMRYLQLRHDVPDDDDKRSTIATLERLSEANVIDDDAKNVLASGYEFLSNLDHNIRLTIGRTTRVPSGNEAVMRNIADRMGFSTPGAVVEALTMHRLAIREAFDAILARPSE